MCLVKNHPKRSPARFCQNWLTNFSYEKAAKKMWATFASFTKLPKVKSGPIGEKSPNLFTLVSRDSPRFTSWGGKKIFAGKQVKQVNRWIMQAQAD
jgi:hypothetical protein